MSRWAGRESGYSLEQLWLPRFLLATGVLLALLVAIFLASMGVGATPLEAGTVLRTIFGLGSAEEELILFDFRLPRIVIALLIGMGLAASGAILQSIARNDLADPGIVGINAGAGLAVLLFFSFFPINQAAPTLFVPLVAFAGGMGAALLIFALAYRKDDGIAPMRLILMGIAIAAGIGAAMYALTVRLSEFVYRFVETWLAGSIWATSWTHVKVLLPWILILLPFAIFRSRTLDIFRLHEHVALGLGASLNRERLIFLAVAVALSAACVAIGGTIAFVGLIAPHVARRIVGPKHQYLLLTSALVGGVLVLGADTIARFAVRPSEIPTGIVVAVIGAPYFLYLLLKSK